MGGRNRAQANQKNQRKNAMTTVAATKSATGRAKADDARVDRLKEQR